MKLSKNLGLAFVSLVAAQEWVAAPKGLEVVSSKLFNGAEISYKKVKKASSLSNGGVANN